MTLPNFLVIGAQKSGTTSLNQYLGGHPDVFTLSKEVHYFDRHHHRGLEWYTRQFAEADGEQAVGETTPEYMYGEQVPALMAETVPEARLIAILRNPVDRAYSAYWHNRTRGGEKLEPAEAFEAETEDGRIVATRFCHLDRGRYLAQLERVCERFPREQVRVVLFEDLKEDRTSVVQDVYRFLGVDAGVVPANIDESRNRFVSYRSQRLREPIRKLPGPMRKAAARLNVKYDSYPALEPQVRTRLVSLFAEDNAALASWLGRDLSVWDR